MPATGMTLKEVAEELGVHYMTVYRYVRLGMLPATKAGASWVVMSDDVAALRNAPIAETSRRGRGSSTTNWSERLESRLRAGDEHGSWSVVEAAMAAGVEPADIYLNVLSPALASIGASWHDGDIGISVEHRATAISLRIVGRIGARMHRRGQTRGTVVMSTPSGERHSLPVTIVSDLVRQAGFDVVDLGSDLPAESFAEACLAVERLVAIGLSVTSPGQEEVVRSTIATLRKELPSTPIVLGGWAISDEEAAHALGADHYADNGRTAVDLFDSLA